MTARLFDGHSAQVREVSVGSDAHGWHIMGDGIHLVWPIATIALDHVGPTHWRLHGPAGAVLELPVGPQADALMAPLRRPARPMSLRHWALLLTSAWLVGAAAYAATPIVASLLAKRIPMSWERAWGEQGTRFFSDRICESPQQVAVLDALRQRLEGEGPSAYVGGVHLVDMGIINAFAMPGGQVIIDTQLLDVISSPEALAGILAHEIGHAHRRHSTQMLIRGALLTSLWQVTVGDYASIFVVDPATFYRIVNLRFDRAAEAEADDDSMAMLQRAHIDPRPVAVFFEFIAGRAKGATWMSSHPDSLTRAKHFADGWVPKEGFLPAMPMEHWAILRTGCTSHAPASP